MTARAPRQWFRSDCQGTTAVEFAVIASVLLPMLFASLSLGFLMWTHNALQSTATLSARCVALGSSLCAANPAQFAVTHRAAMDHTRHHQCQERNHRYLRNILQWCGRFVRIVCNGIDYVVLLGVRYLARSIRGGNAPCQRVLSDLFRLKHRRGSGQFAALTRRPLVSPGDLRLNFWASMLSCLTFLVAICQFFAPPTKSYKTL